MEVCYLNPFLLSHSENYCTSTYVETVLEPVVQPLTDTLFEEEDCIVQQVLAPANKSKLIQGKMFPIL